ncbi:hypothetical protein AMATHDRAFT_4519 [Amanita thiersii Skay4041]|uniref:Uncharacterized protein n=1 Tax=Amanita thiersii Skay4041 TaxID=703135 RepID=A0A2A9NNJ1_9AGAR|nr:hypothetical protein AMATHDRAFT_4519 [Amanita thiersii Skay4041]
MSERPGIHDLPTEILELIFDEYTSPSHFSRSRSSNHFPKNDIEPPACAALTLSHVCRLWKSLLRPSHWSRICVQHTRHPKILHLLIARSGTQDLDISVRLGYLCTDFFMPRTLDNVKNEMLVYHTWHTVLDEANRLRSLSVVASRPVLVMLQKVLGDRQVEYSASSCSSSGSTSLGLSISAPVGSALEVAPLTKRKRPFTLALKHLSLKQVDRGGSMTMFEPAWFNFESCTSLRLARTCIGDLRALMAGSLREMQIVDFRADDLIRLTHRLEVDGDGGLHYRLKQPPLRFESLERLEMRNLFFILGERQVKVFLAAFPNVRELVLDRAHSEIIVRVLIHDMTLLPNLERIIVQGVEVQMGWRSAPTTLPDGFLEMLDCILLMDD